MQWNIFSQLSNLKSQCWIVRSHIIVSISRACAWQVRFHGVRLSVGEEQQLHLTLPVHTDISKLTFLDIKENRHVFIWLTNYFWTQISANIFMASHSPKWILPFSSPNPCKLVSIGWNAEFKVQERKWDLTDIITLWQSHHLFCRSMEAQLAFLCWTLKQRQNRCLVKKQLK